MHNEATGDYEVVLSNETTTEVVRRVKALNLGVRVIHHPSRIPLVLDSTSMGPPPPPPSNTIVMPSTAYDPSTYERSERAYKAKKKKKAALARDPKQRWRC